MATTYKAILTGDRLQWLGEAPETNGGIPVEVTVTRAPAPLDEDARRRQLIAAMDALVASGVAENFGDPIEWQREVRKDRPLPGRED